MKVSIAILAGLYLTALITGAWNQSITIDESAHLAAGLSNLQLNRFELYAVNPPLVKMVAALPVLKMHAVTNWSSAGSVYGSRNEFLFGNSFVEQNSSRSPSLYRAARLACLPFGILGLWMCYRWGCDLHGERGGLLAAVSWAFSPLILGHGSLITPDVPAAATGMLAIYRFRMWLNATSVWNAMWLGIFAGIALLTKFTWAPLFPVIGLLGWIAWRAGQCFRWSVLRRDLWQLLVTSVAALYVVNTLYGFDRSFTKLGEYEFVSSEFTKSPASARPQDLDKSGDRVNRFTGTWLGTIPVPLPMCFLQGIDVQRRDFEPGRMGQSYLMGEWKVGGWWYYYVMGLLVKEPLGWLILLAMSFVSCFPRLLAALRVRRATQINMNTADGSLQPAHVPWREYVILLLPAVLVFVLVSRESGFNHHVRYIIPALPFLFVFASRLAVFTARSRIGQSCVSVLIAWQLASVLWYGPYWLSYFNEIAGGPENGDQWLLSSNIDWGQDLLNLKTWQEQHPEADPLFTVVNSQYSPTVFGVKVQLPEFLTRKPDGPNVEGSLAAESYRPEPGWYAISVTALHGARGSVFSPSSTSRANPARVAWFKDRTPIDRVGYSIRIYHVVSDDLSLSPGLQEHVP